VQQQAVDLGLDLSHATLEKGELEYPGKAEELALREKLQAERQARGEAADSGEEYEGMDDDDGEGGGGDGGGGGGGDGESEGGAEVGSVEVGAMEASTRGAALFQHGVETVEEEAS
jgi:hypothetical protein